MAGSAKAAWVRSTAPVTSSSARRSRSRSSRRRSPSDGAARARFNQEAKLASQISHPNIVSVVDYGEDPQFGAYMVMELVEGEPLVAHGRADVDPAHA